MKCVRKKLLPCTMSYHLSKDYFLVLNSLAENDLRSNGQNVSDKTSEFVINPSSAKSTKWSNTLKQFVGNLPTNCLSVFDHFVGLALKGLKYSE